MPGSKVVDTDKGYRALLAAADKAGDFKVTVGLHAEDAFGTMVQAAEANEFGTGDIPARPSITAWADEQRTKAIQEIRDETAKALKAGVSPAQRLDALAQKYAGEIQTKIAGGIPPPNAPATVARKGSSTPLIDYGTFRSSIRGKVGKP